MRKVKYIMIPIVVVLTIAIWQLNRKTICRFPADDRVVISSVQYGPFVEWIPLTGIAVHDTARNTHHVSVQVDEMYLTRLDLGLKATTQVIDSVYELELKYIHPHVVDGRITVDMNFVGAMPSIRNERPLRIRLELNNPTETFLLPTGSFFRDTGGKWVFVVENDSAIRREVRFGRKNSDCIEVIEGLKPGERVITSSYQAFMEKESFALPLE